MATTRLVLGGLRTRSVLGGDDENKMQAIGEEGLGCLWIGDEGGWAEMRDR